MKRILRGWLLAAALASRALGQGTILWDESTSGPLSQDSVNPTALAEFQFGTNSLAGATTVERIGSVWFGHDDFFLVRVPSGAVVSSVFVTVDRPNAGIWLGDPGYSNRLAFVLNPSSGSLLSQWQLTSIDSGQYGMSVGNNDLQAPSTVLNYRLDFVVQPIPEPASLWLLLGGLGCLGLRRWRKS